MESRLTPDRDRRRRSDGSRADESAGHAAEPRLPIMVAPALVTKAAADLLDAVELGEAPLRAISDALTCLATAVGATRAIASVDHATLGRQVFCSHRAPLNDATDALWGDQCLRIEPPGEIEHNAERVLLAATRIALGSLALARAEFDRTRLTTELRAIVATAASNAARHGWGFTLALVHCDAPHRLGSSVESGIGRAGDTVAVVDSSELAVVLPATQPEAVAATLAQLSQQASLPTFSYGIASCPADATSADELLQIAALRLADTLVLRDQPSETIAIGTN